MLADDVSILVTHRNKEEAQSKAQESVNTVAQHIWKLDKEKKDSNSNTQMEYHTQILVIQQHIQEMQLVHRREILHPIYATQKWPPSTKKQGCLLNAYIARNICYLIFLHDFEDISIVID